MKFGPQQENSKIVYSAQMETKFAVDVTQTNQHFFTAHVLIVIRLIEFYVFYDVNIRSVNWLIYNHLCVVLWILCWECLCMYICLCMVCVHVCSVK